MVRNDAGGLSPKEEKNGTNKVVELVGIVVFALLLAFLIQLFLVKTYRIPSGSMEPTLDIGQRVLVNRIGMRFGEPKVGDIVVFHPPEGADVRPLGACGTSDEGVGTTRPCSVATPGASDQTFIKRVVAVGGDTVAIRGGRVVLNGRVQDEPFIRPCGPEGACSFPTAVTVPDGSFYMLGDNRGASDDSRFWGPVKEDQLIGTAFATYWPPNRIGLF
ncbi:signal peptidase I [Conexibacter arvalis]|nr:signal peptidase I [Conexibacter arvalis]